jgi:hypothetical protein
MSDPTTSGEADRHGYTQQVVIDGDELGIGVDAFIKPGTDTGGTFKAFDCNHQRTVTLDGSKVTVRDNP